MQPRPDIANEPQSWAELSRVCMQHGPDQGWQELVRPKRPPVGQHTHTHTHKHTHTHSFTHTHAHTHTHTCTLFWSWLSTELNICRCDCTLEMLIFQILFFPKFFLSRVSWCSRKKNRQKSILQNLGRNFFSRIWKLLLESKFFGKKSCSSFFHE